MNFFSSTCSKKQLLALRLTTVISLLCVTSFFNVFANQDDVITQIALPKSTCSFAGEFTQNKTIAGLDQTLESSGSFYYHCEKGVIWSTDTPVDETLIFNRFGDNFKIKDQSVNKFTGRQGKLLGKLLNSMMSGNQAEIESLFELRLLHDKNHHFELIPKKKSLKRAIKVIDLTFSHYDNDDLANDDNSQSALNQITIQIRDRNDQITLINSIQNTLFELLETDPVDTFYQQCLSTNVSSLACDQLNSTVPSNSVSSKEY